MTKSISFILVASLAILAQLRGSLAELTLTDETQPDRQPQWAPVVPEKAERFRFSRSVKSSDIVGQTIETQEPQQVVVEQVSTKVASQMPQFSKAQPEGSLRELHLHHQRQQSHQQQSSDSPSFSSHLPKPTLPSSLPDLHSPQFQLDSNDQQQISDSQQQPQPLISIDNSGPVRTYTYTWKSAPLLTQQPVVAQLKQVRVHTFPVHQASYVVAAPAARLVETEAGSSSSSSSHKSSSSSSSSITTSQTSETVLAPQPAPVLAAPLIAPTPGPDCVLQRLIVQRPVSSALVVKVPNTVQVLSSSGARLVESSGETTVVAAEPAVAPVCCVVSKVVQPVVTAKLVVPPIANNGGHSKEEHFHTETRSSREQADGLGGFSSSSSSSRTSKSSSSSTTTTQQQTAALVAAPPVVTRTVTVVQPTSVLVEQPAPTLVAVKAAPLVAIGEAGSKSSVQVDHHYADPTVKYGYSIKQQSSEPVVGKGFVVGDRPVYLK